jgi:hypothetical protein
LRFIWDYLIGPFLALLPLRWRRQLPGLAEADWTRAGAVSGMYEMAGAIVALGYWYMYEMNVRIAQIMNGEANGRAPVGLSEHQVQGAALTIFAMSPLTWFLFYLFAEGAGRLCAAAFADNVSGSLPLYLMERLMFWIRKPEEARVGERVRENAQSFSEALRERLMVAGLEVVPDEVHPSTDGDDEFLDIRASRRKEDWVAPRIVHIGELYYRLESSSVGSGPRPFCYRLRRLPAGVPGRTVIVYKIER